MKNLNELLNENLINESKAKEFAEEGLGYVDIEIDFEDFVSNLYFEYLERKHIDTEFDTNFKVRLFYLIDVFDEEDGIYIEKTDIKVLTPCPPKLPRTYYNEFKESVAIEWCESFNLDDKFLEKFKKKDKNFSEKLKEELR